MNKAASQSRVFLALGIPLLMLVSLIFLMKSSSVSENRYLSMAISADLILTVPLIYFLLIRKTEIPKTTVVPIMILGLVIGTYFLPKENQHYLDLFKYWFLPVIELSIFTFVVLKVRKTRIKFKSLKASNSAVDFYSILKEACAEILPKKVVLPVATEFAVMYYGFINWKKRKIGENEFTHHKNSGSQALFFAIVFIILVETVALHFVFIRWSHIAAWILSGLSIYTAIQVIGFAKSLSQRPISMNADSVTFRYGILNEVEVPFSQIESIEQSAKSLEKAPLTKTLSPLGELESHNMILRLKSESKLVGLYGMKKKFNTLLFHIDEPVKFAEAINAHLSS